jgi:D-psicose/D-tagatose/L-ribulose 3-epimerase
MNISVSNIAWEVTDDYRALEILNEFNISTIDIAPTKYFIEPLKARESEIIKVRDFWNSRNISIYGMQSLLFGTTGFNIFNPKDSRNQLLSYLDAICKLGASLGIKKLVFGSPKNRNSDGIEKSQINEIAKDFFLRLGDIAFNYGVDICLEPNPKEYSCNFMTNTLETIEVVKMVNHPNILMQIDTGSIFMNNEDPSIIAILPKNKVGHIHISEPMLGPIGFGGNNHLPCYNFIRNNFPDSIITIEMSKGSHENYLVELRESIKFTVDTYK